MSDTPQHLIRTLEMLREALRRELEHVKCLRMAIREMTELVVKEQATAALQEQQEQQEQQP
jgi:hypothetical protein